MRIIYRLLFCLIPLFVQAQQLRFNASSANIDSFPAVRFNITISENGSIPSPPLDPTNFTVTEDGNPVNVQLSDCDDSRRAAVVVCIDHSGSMLSSAGDGFNVSNKFLNCFSSLLSNFKPNSKYALLPFAYTADVVYPEPPHIPFYQAQNAVDLSDAMSVISGLTFMGGTDVDRALFKAASVLEYSGLPTKAIVLVTDDYIKYPDSVQTRLEQLGIMLCVFQVGSDFTKYSLDIAQSTGGQYFQANDTNSFDAIMLELSEFLSAEHCILSYVSPNPCPWYKLHQVSLTLNRGTQSRNLLRSYSLNSNFNDKTPPPITVLSPSYITRRVTATGNFPCERGLKDFRDSLRENFGIYQRSRTYPTAGTDSMRVQDSMNFGRAIYIAIDSANNQSVLEFSYTPQRDTLPPEIALTSSTGGSYRALITETRAWDRGLFSTNLAPGAINLVFDSVRWYSKTTGQIWFHQPDPLGVSTGCIEVTDSVGNIATYCIDRGGPAGDTLPPVITQNVQQMPRVITSASITELRPNDRGIKQITSSALANFANPQITWANRRQATIRFDIVDSLTSARAFLSSSDSADNVASDTIRYDPLPDIAAPICLVETVDVSTKKFRTTDLSPWDRGIRDVTIVGIPTNLSVSPVVFVDRFEAEQTFTLIDKTIAGNVVIRSTDSVGHECLTTIDIEPSEIAPRPLIPLEVVSALDFGIVFAPADMTLPVSIRNPNDRPVVVTKLDLTGDVEFTVTNGATPFFFAPLETKPLDIRYQSSLLGIHTAILTLSNDTMQLSRTNIRGQSVGNVLLSFDSVSVNAPGEIGILHLSVEATPNPINLDSIRFRLTYNRDVAVLSPQTPDCNGGNPLCDYSVNYSGDPETGSIDVELIRADRSRNQSLSGGRARIDIPFVTFLAKDAITSVVARDAAVSQSSVVASDTGYIHVGSYGCGIELMRAALRNESLLSFLRIAPNPAHSKANLTIYSAAQAQATLSIFDTKGVCADKKSIQLAKAINDISLDTHNLSVGSYILTLSTTEGFTTAILVVTR